MWSATKKKLENLLCNSLVGRVEYFCTMYRMSHDGRGRACIYVDNSIILNCSDIYFDYKWSDPSRYIRGEGGHYSVYTRRQFSWWTIEDTQTGNKIYSSEAFFEAVGFLFDNPVSKCIDHSNDIVVCLALVDRRIGKRTLMKIGDQIQVRSDLVKFFYQLRCDSEKIQTQYNKDCPDILNP